jgi:ABC-2 type transport system ATP-binding protein
LKKIVLCSALITEAPYLLLDEPFSGGLDPSGIMALKRVLQRLAERDDITIVLTTPVPELVEELADRIAIVRDGQLAAFDSVDGLRRQTGTDGPLADVLQRLLNPETLANIEHYFERDANGDKP